MTSLFGRNPVAMAVVGVALLVIGLVTHSHFMPWIGGALLVVGGIKTAARLQKRSPADGEDEGRLMR